MTLGGLSVVRQDELSPPVSVQRRPLIVLAIVAASGPVGLTRDKLIGLLWPDRESDRARNVLDQALSALRRAFNGDVVRTTSTGVVYDADYLPCDVVEFDEAVRIGDASRAATCYTGPFLDGVSLNDAPEFERWADGQRARRLREAGAAFETLASAAAAAGDHRTAVAWWERDLALDPLSSHATVGLMRALGVAGERARALDVARVYGTLMQQELGAPPDAAVTATADELRRQRPVPPPPMPPPSLAPAAAAPPGPTAAAPPAVRARWPWMAVAAVAALAATAVIATAGLRKRGRREALPIAASPSIAVLPFANFTADHTADYLSDGLTEELITALAQVPTLHVCARTSAWTFKDKPADVRDIGRALGVSSVLEGSVQQTGRRLRVTVQLIDTRAGYHVWSAQYDRTLDDVFAVEDEITKAVVGALSVRLTSGMSPRPASVSAVDPDAYLLYLQGRYAWHERTPEAFHRAVHEFELALAKDVRYAPAYAGLADVYVVLPVYEPVSPAAAYENAIKNAERALALDTTMAGPHATLGIARQRLYDWDGALAEYRRALVLNPNDATAHQWYGKALAEHGDLAGGEAQVRLGLALDPLSAVTAYNLGQILFWQRRYHDAEEQVRAALALRSSFYQAHTLLGLIAAADGRPRDALAEFRQVVQMERQREADDVALLGYGYAIAGARDSATALLRQILADTARTPVSGTDVATLFMALGDHDAAFAWLERARLQYDTDLEAFIRAPTLVPLTSDPRFARLRAEIHD